MKFFSSNVRIADALRTNRTPRADAAPLTIFILEPQTPNLPTQGAYDVNTPMRNAARASAV